MARLFLVRHGKIEGEDGLYFGYSNVPLSHEGIKQAEKLKSRLSSEKLAAIYSSDLDRAQKTAEIISSPHNLKVSLKPELRELNFGLLEGKSFDKIHRLYPRESRIWFASPDLAAPGGESLKDLAKRLKSFLSIVNKSRPEDSILLVSHKGALRALICLLIGLKLQDYWKISLDPASLTIVETYEEGAILQLLNDTSHLGLK